MEGEVYEVLGVSRESGADGGREERSLEEGEREERSGEERRELEEIGKKKRIKGTAGYLFLDSSLRICF